MYLTIDGKRIQAVPGKSLLDLIRELGLDGNYLSERPLAAKIAGEVFTLNYIPLRQKELDPDRPSIRRAMEASGGEVRLLYYPDAAGRECYIRTAKFALFLALRQLYPKSRSKISCTLGASVYVKVEGAADFSASALRTRMMELVRQNIPLIRRRVNVDDAIDRYLKDGQTDKAQLLKWRNLTYFDEY